MDNEAHFYLTAISVAADSLVREQVEWTDEETILLRTAALALARQLNTMVKDKNDRAKQQKSKREHGIDASYLEEK